jgi:DNA-directed RNA polymerase subunit RPC12/RpoP
MTFQKRCLIELSEIIAVQYECGKCGSAIIVPLDRVDPERIAGITVNNCPHCQTQTGFQMGVEETKIFLHFNNLLRQVRGVMTGRNLKMRLEVKVPE